MPRLAANLTMLFGEHDFLDRPAAAAEAGFDAVEFLFPYDHPAEQVCAALDAAGTELVLYNLPAGDWGGRERGLAALPDRVEDFRAGVERALAYAAVLEPPRLNALAGLRAGDREAQWATLVDNVRWAGERLADAGITLVVEPVNDKDVEGFFLPSTTDAIRLLDEVGDPRIKLQFDVFHVTRQEGDMTTRMRALWERIDHLQVADSPGRHQPGTGEIDFSFVFAEIDRLGYTGAVGLEYVPDPDTLSSLAWREQLIERSAS